VVFILYELHVVYALRYLVKRLLVLYRFQNGRFYFFYCENKNLEL